MTVREFIEPMYKMGVSIQACGKYVDKDFPNETYSRNRFYCRCKSVTDLKTEKDFEEVLDYTIGCVIQKGSELIIQVS